MKLRLNKREPLNIVNFTEYLFVLMMILNANTIWTSYEDTPLNRALKVGIVVVGIFYIVVQKLLLNKAIQNILLSIAFGLVYVVLYSFAIGYKTTGFVYFVCTVIAVYSFLQIANSRNRGSEILYKYRDIILIVAVVSLFFWLLGSVLGILHPTGTVYSTWVGKETDVYKTVSSYYGLYFETQDLDSVFGITADITRNTAVFTEAPMCNFNFCMALLIELFYNPNTSKSRCVILIVAILSTISTTGYCMLAIALTAKYLTSSRKSRGLMELIKVLAVPTIIVVAALAFQFFVETKMDTGSGISRLRDFMVGFEAWSHKPFFGYGYGKPTYYLGIHYGYSNSIMPILGNGGLFLALPYLYCIFQWCRTCIKEKDFQKFLLFANFMFLFTITIMSYKYLSIFIFFAYCVKRKKPIAHS